MSYSLYVYILAPVILVTSTLARMDIDPRWAFGSGIIAFVTFGVLATIVVKALNQWRRQRQE